MPREVLPIMRRRRRGVGKKGKMVVIAVKKLMANVGWTARSIVKFIRVDSGDNHYQLGRQVSRALKACLRHQLLEKHNGRYRLTPLGNLNASVYANERPPPVGMRRVPRPAAPAAAARPAPAPAAPAAAARPAAPAPAAAARPAHPAIPPAAGPLRLHSPDRRAVAIPVPPPEVAGPLHLHR